MFIARHDATAALVGARTYHSVNRSIAATFALALRAKDLATSLACQILLLNAILSPLAMAAETVKTPEGIQLWSVGPNSVDYTYRLGQEIVYQISCGAKPYYWQAGSMRLMHTDSVNKSSLGKQFDYVILTPGLAVGPATTIILRSPPFGLNTFQAYYEIVRNGHSAGAFYLLDRRGPFTATRFAADPIRPIETFKQDLDVSTSLYAEQAGDGSLFLADPPLIFRMLQVPDIPISLDGESYLLPKPAVDLALIAAGNSLKARYEAVIQLTHQAKYIAATSLCQHVAP